ncbi:MAG: GHMP kinase [Actinomycetota bacterium]|nr:GHMP kinase [Actinomycetota bacterium]
MNCGDSQKRIKVVNSIAPIRICDNGGWTDTWFAEHGKIFNIGVYPYVETQIEVFPISAKPDRITLYAENYGEQYIVKPDAADWDRHPLLEAAIEYMNIPKDVALQISIFSEAPAGCSTGTSAAVSVALIGALDCLTYGKMTPHEVAYAAHKVETDLLHLQSGIQDQLCSAYGGINYMEMYKYPFATISQIHIPNSIWWELERRLVLIFMGKSHKSSAVHEKVIAELENEGSESPRLEKLRKTAELSRDALYSGDFDGLGKAMIANTEAQGELSSYLISDSIMEIIEIAKQCGAIGWKVNGAGGEGGSLTLLCGEKSSQKRCMIQEIEKANPRYKSIPIYLSRFGVTYLGHLDECKVVNRHVKK